MSTTDDVLTLLVTQLRGGELIPPKEELRRFDSEAAYEYRISAELNELGVGSSECARRARARVKKVAIEVAELAKTKMLERLRTLTKRESDKLNDVWRDIRTDFGLITKALMLGINDEVVNGLLVCYKAGTIPTFSAHYSGTIESVLEMSSADAKRVVREAEPRAKQLREALARKREAARKLQELARKELRLELTTTTGGLPTSRGLERCFRPNGVFARASTRLVMVSSELGKIKVPDVWRGLLDAQSAGKPIPWVTVWSPSVRKQFSSSWKLISEKCLGVGIAVGRGFSPSLLYIFATPQESFPGGKFYFAYIGGPPIGDAGLANDELRSRFEVLPVGLQEFYKTVHDGWTVLSGSDGPLPLKNLKFLSELVSEEEAFGELKKKPFSLDTTLEIMSTGGGDALCLDAKRSRPQKPVGIFYRHETPEESDVNVDFWKVLNNRIEAGTEQWLGSTKGSPQKSSRQG